MFESESDLQSLIDSHPEIILSGLPEIDPQLCPDAPRMLSLGRETPLSSGAVDNLFIDTNAILTFVECKRYSDTRIRREVYPQALNYASDLQGQLIRFEGDEFLSSFFDVISRASGFPYESMDSLIEALAEDPIIGGKNRLEWRRQFTARL